MTAEELLLNEYEVSKEKLQAAELVQDKAVKLQLAIMIALVTLIVKGDIPETGYLFLAVILLVSGSYVSALSHDKVAAIASLRISEMRVRHWAARELDGTRLFDMSERYLYLRQGFPRKRLIGRLHSHLRTATLVTVYFFFLVRGAIAADLSSKVFLTTVIAGTLVLSLFTFGIWAENRSMKGRFRKLVRTKGEEGVPELGRAIGIQETLNTEAADESNRKAAEQENAGDADAV